MRHGWVHLYESGPAPTRFDETFDHFELDGISLTEPASSRIIRVSDIGDQIPSSRQDIREKLEQSPVVRFNFYLGPSDNLFCSIEKLGDGLVRESYSLGGKTEEQSWQVIHNLVGLFSARSARQRALAMVADRYAELHRDFHWDDFMIGDNPAPPE